MSARERIAGAQRIVVKIGSSSLTHRDGSLDAERIDELVAQIARRQSQGHRPTCRRGVSMWRAVVSSTLRPIPVSLWPDRAPCTQRSSDSTGRLGLDSGR